MIIYYDGESVYLRAFACICSTLSPFITLRERVIFIYYYFIHDRLRKVCNEYLPSPVIYMPVVCLFACLLSSIFNSNNNLSLLFWVRVRTTKKPPFVCVVMLIGKQVYLTTVCVLYYLQGLNLNSNLIFLPRLHSLKLL